MAGGIAYVADIGQDVDDLVAIYALRRLGILSYVVARPEPGDETGRERLRRLEGDGVRIVRSLPGDSDVVFVGGALTAVAEFLSGGGRIGSLVMNGGFAGEGAVPRASQLGKFSGRRVVRTYNFNLDVRATDFVLRSDGVGSLFLIGKNVCHSPLNTTRGIWRDCDGFLGRFRLSPRKRLHDLLVVCEGLVLVGLSDEPLSCEYASLWPYNTGLRGGMTEWGSTTEPAGYRKAMVAVGWASDAPRHELVPAETKKLPPEPSEWQLG